MMQATPFMLDIPARPWRKARPPRRVLAIRLQAMGDTVITLPYLQSLRRQLPPGTQLDFLTRREVDPIPRHIELFDRVWSIGGGRSFKKVFLYALWLLPRLLARRYEVVIDLQNNIVSETVRKALRPAAWSVFDRFSPVAAGERTRLTIDAVGLGAVTLDTRLRLKDESVGARLLRQQGWNGRDALVVLNPAGFVVTRNWSVESYIAFARGWQAQYPGTRFVLLGTALIREKAAAMKKALGSDLFNLVETTNVAEAFAVLQQARLVLSEDSGLMHMAWVSGIPTMVLFGSTRSDWARPLGPHSFFFDSSDLPCGNCMETICKRGDIHCMTRYRPEQVLEQALRLLPSPQPAITA